MTCPDCQIKLVTIDLNGFKIHECDNCLGRWLDREELRKLKDKEDENIRWLDFDPFGRDAEKLSVPSEGKKCPNCRKKMNSLNFQRSGVIIDKCSACEGVWLDCYEFEKIINYLEDVVTKESAKDYTIDTFKQFIEIVTGHEGVTSEVKDLLAVFNLLQIRIAVEHPKLAELSEKLYKLIPFK